MTQKTAWFMLQRIREAFRRDDDDNDPMGGGRMGGPVEVDGTRMGGKRKNMPKSKREAMTGRGGAGKSIVVGAKDRETGEVRAEAVPSTDRSTLQGLVADHACPDAEVRTDERSACAGMPFDHRTVSRSPGEHVRDLIHTNGIESFRSMFKRARKGVYHKMSPKHLHRHVTDFAGRQTVRKRSTLPQMQRIADGMIGRRLECRRLIADNGLWNGADGCVPA
ncbi:MAG: IS1595 family transposase [Rhodobacteraceae bacterium]|nr:IS1595 family transposase [Paracoccaceae bacterium]